MDVNQATVPFDKLHATWTGVNGLRLLQLLAENAQTVCLFTTHVQNKKDVFSHDTKDALKHIYDSLTRSMDEPIDMGIEQEFKEKDLHALAKSSAAFMKNVASAQKDAFKDAARPYQTILSTID